ncbi:hypothetical protein F2982_21260 (plasmid) [Rhizobium sp. BG4]|nr:hypothetical protein F2982_21260 [Rhizobium sp. BG4]
MNVGASSPLTRPPLRSATLSLRGEEERQRRGLPFSPTGRRWPEGSDEGPLARTAKKDRPHARQQS